MILHTEKCSKGKKKVTIGDISELIGKTTLFDAKLCADLENLIIELLLIFTLHQAVDYHGKFITKVYALVFPDQRHSSTDLSLVLVLARPAIAGPLRLLFGLLLGAPVGITFRIVIVLIVIRAIGGLFATGDS